MFLVADWRPVSVPVKTVRAPKRSGLAGPRFAARETTVNLQIITQRRGRLAFAFAASDFRFSILF